MAPSKKSKQSKFASPPASNDTSSQSTTTATITATTAPETASELEPVSVPDSEPVPEPVTAKPSKKRSKKDASITKAPTSTTTPATFSPTTASDETASLPKKARTSGRKRVLLGGKWGVRDSPPAIALTDRESGSASSESATSTTAAARFTPSPIRGWSHATPESMATAKGCSSRSKGKNSKGKSSKPPVSTATKDVMDTITYQNAITSDTNETATATAGGNTNNGTNSPTPEFDPDATETDPDLTETDPDSGSDYSSQSGHNQITLPRRPTRPLRPSCQQQVQIINNVSTNFSYDGNGMVGMNHPPNTYPTAGSISPLGTTLSSFPPHVDFEDPNSRKHGLDGEELIYPRIGTFSPSLRPTSDFPPSSSSTAVTSLPFLPLPSSNLSSRLTLMKPRSNTTSTTTTTTPTAFTGAGQSSDRGTGARASATPANGRGRGAPSTLGDGTARQTATNRTAANTPKTARRYRTGLAGRTVAQGNGHTVTTAFSNNNVAPDHNGHGHGNNNGNSNAMDVDGGNNSGGSSTNNNVRDNSNNIVRYGNGLVRRVGNQPIIAHSHIPRRGITPAEIGASLSLDLIRRREEARRLRVEEEQRKEEDRRRNAEEVRRRLARQAQQNVPSGTSTSQQESSSSSVPASPSTQHTLTSVQHTPPLRHNPQHYPRNQSLHGQSPTCSGNSGQSPPPQLFLYHATNHQPGNHTQHQQPLQHHQSSYSSQHHQSSQLYQPSQYQQHLQHPQHPGSQSHHRQFNVHQSSSYHSLTPSNSPSASNDYLNFNNHHFSSNHYSGNQLNYNQHRSSYNNQYYHSNNNHRYQPYNSYNNTASFSASIYDTILFPHPSQPYGPSRPWQGSLRHDSHPHPRLRRHIPFPSQQPDTLLANAHSHRYTTSVSIRTSRNLGLRMLTSPEPQPPAWLLVSRNPGSPTQHHFLEYDQMMRASQAEFATLPPIRVSTAQGLQVQASSNHGPIPVHVPMPSSHPSSPSLLSSLSSLSSSSSSSSGHSGHQQQQQQQQDSASDGQSENHESDNDADDECSSGSA
ncbi:hypothetical protein K457DRAFT_20414 [Linnemannia elongata AG-77]|uniref:Uncharacterized protein n=1 Tax=Linnemannia elongata AG-77 TaxID=1314771 RepID=A0A197JUX2_9FUNG|nr:hypothetical protein K457DRAFT_20414 [Linnemannia elongata AG-77]